MYNVDVSTNIFFYKNKLRFVNSKGLNYTSLGEG